MRPGEPAAMQTRCPACLGEQYVMNVIAFSAGEVPCGRCGQRTRPMTDRDWRIAIRARRRELDPGPTEN